jgi:hypothetical protein
MKTKLILLFIIFHNSLFSQIAYEDDVKSGLLLRGKVLGFVVVEDWWALNATAGVEFRFTKNFSLEFKNLFILTYNFPIIIRSFIDYIKYSFKCKFILVLKNLRKRYI